MKEADCNWVRKRFKKNKVWMAMDKNGAPLTRNNKVLIKYQLDQEHEYWVNPASVSELGPDEPKQKKRSVRQNGSRCKAKAAKSTPEVRPETGENMITIYTDGASSGNPGPSGIGIYMLYGGHEREISRNIGNATNNIAELTAIKTALQELKRADLPVRIYTDSSYACGLLINGWKAKKNVALVNSIRTLMKRFSDLKIIKVKGHSGLAGNEKADQLATSAITRNSP